MNMRIGTAFVTSLLATSVWADVACAQTVDGRFRLGLEAIMVETQSVSVKGTFTDESGEEQIVDSQLDRSSSGLLASTLGLGLGLGFGDHVVLGARILQGSQGVKINDGVETTSSSVSFLPFAEFLLSSHTPFQPYLGVTAGIRTGSTEVDNDEVSNFDSTLTGLNLGAHIFVSDSFSIDPALSFLYVSETAEETVGGSLEPVKLEGSGTLILLSFGLTGWLGSNSGPAPAPAPRRRRAPRQDPDVTQEAAARADEPEHIPTPGVTSASEEEVVLRMQLVNRGTLRLAGKPAQDGRRIEAHLLAYGDPVFESCSDISLRVGDDAVNVSATDVRYGRKPRGDSGIDILQGKLDIVDLATFVKASKDYKDDPRITACGEEYAFTMAQTSSIKEFAQKFVKAAKQAGTLKTKSSDDGADESDAADGGDGDTRGASDESPPE